MIRENISFYSRKQSQAARSQEQIFVWIVNLHKSKECTFIQCQSKTLTAQGLCQVLINALAAEVRESKKQTLFLSPSKPREIYTSGRFIKKGLTSIPSQECSWLAKGLGTKFHCLSCKLFRTHDYVKNESLARAKSRKYHFILIWDTERRKGLSCVPLAGRNFLERSI